MSRALAFALGALLLCPTRARAFVRETTPAGAPVAWASSCAFVTPDSNAPWGWSDAGFAAAAAQAVQAWQSATFDAGAYLQLKLDDAASVEAHLDYTNVIKVRHDVWCRPAETGRAQLCFSPEAASITTMFFEPDGGAIIDADIELNDLNFTFLDETNSSLPRPGTSPADLLGTLTHELGHLQGLDHTCWTHATATAPLDDQGQPIPDCNDVPSLPQGEKDKVMSSVMYPYAVSGLSQRAPSPDDVAGVVAIYPSAKDPNQCVRVTPPSDPPPGGCGCGPRGGEPSGAILLLLAPLGLRFGRRRRPRSLTAR